MMTPGAVKKFADGEWDGTPFVAELFQEPRKPEQLQQQLRQGTRDARTVFISDGLVKLPIGVTPEIDIANLENYSLIEVTKADYQLHPGTTLFINKRPGQQLR